MAWVFGGGPVKLAEWLNAYFPWGIYANGRYESCWPCRPEAWLNSNPNIPWSNVSPNKKYWPVERRREGGRTNRMRQKYWVCFPRLPVRLVCGIAPLRSVALHYVPTEHPSSAWQPNLSQKKTNNKNPCSKRKKKLFSELPFKGSSELNNVTKGPFLDSRPDIWFVFMELFLHFHSRSLSSPNCQLLSQVLKEQQVWKQKSLQAANLAQSCCNSPVWKRGF